ncbi:MAG TPA: DUF2905 domain-containing protein [Chloroflexota bacterium]|nr:DUF2905 domain-containing protein [Chloroflexota bacterium]
MVLLEKAAWRQIRQSLAILAFVADLGKLLIGAGVLLVLAGIAFLLAGRIPYLGRLPGDIAVQHGSFGFYFPIVTCILVSLVLTVLLNLGTRLFR